MATLCWVFTGPAVLYYAAYALLCTSCRLKI